MPPRSTLIDIVTATGNTDPSVTSSDRMIVQAMNWPSVTDDPRLQHNTKTQVPQIEYSIPRTKQHPVTLSIETKCPLTVDLHRMYASICGSTDEYVTMFDKRQRPNLSMLRMSMRLPRSRRNVIFQAIGVPDLDGPIIGPSYKECVIGRNNYPVDWAGVLSEKGNKGAIGSPRSRRDLTLDSFKRAATAVNNSIQGLQDCRILPF
ncbi:hypothetical protein KEM55_009318, partial [Ascosphaera atra]